MRTICLIVVTTVFFGNDHAEPSSITGNGTNKKKANAFAEAPASKTKTGKKKTGRKIE